MSAPGFVVLLTWAHQLREPVRKPLLNELKLNVKIK